MSERSNSPSALQTQLLERFPWMRWLKPPAPTLNTGRLLTMVLEEFEPSAHPVLDLGCGQRHIAGVVRCDIALSRPPGIRADAARLPFADASFACVIATALLEHVPNPRRVVREIHRVLRPGGVVYVEVPFMEGYHAHPDDYQRFTFRGLEILFGRFKIVDREVCVGPSSALCWMLREYPAAWVTSPRVALVLKWLAAWVTAPIKYLDYFLAKAPGAFRTAAGLGIVARRKERQ